MPTCSDDGGGDKVHALMPKVISIALAAVLPASAVAADSLSNMRAAVQDKTEAAGMTAEQVEFLAGRLNAFGASAAEIEDAPALKTNESGQTYGIALLEPDLVAVTATNGKIGYVYRSEIEDEPFEITSSSDRDADPGDYQRPKSIPVYESDGRTQVGRFVPTEAVTGKQGALMAKRAHPRAVSAFKSFLKGKKGYYLITRLGGSGQPVMLWSKHRLGGYTANIVSNSKLFAYEKGKVELVNTVANGSSGEWLTTYKGKLRFGDYRSRNYVTVRNGAFQGACYSVKWAKGGKASYWKQKIVNGKKLGAKKRVGAKLGEKRVYESLGKTLKFMKLPKAAREHTQTQMEGRFRVLRS